MKLTFQELCTVVSTVLALERLSWHLIVKPQGDSMNTELKALVVAAWAFGLLAADVVTKQALLKDEGDAVAFLSDIPGAVSDWGDLSAEIKALPGSAQEADLLAFIAEKAAGLGLSVKAESILSASLAWAQATASLVGAIVVPAAPAAPASVV